MSVNTVDIPQAIQAGRWAWVFIVNGSERSVSRVDDVISNGVTNEGSRGMEV